MISGRSRGDGKDVYVALEISSAPDEDDVRRAVRRAGLLAKVGLRAIPAVAGAEVADRVVAAAESQDVAVVRDGLLISWPGAAA